jgi:hypothetical protein
VGEELAYREAVAESDQVTDPAAVSTRAEKLQELASNAFRMTMSHADDQFELSPIDAKILVMYGRIRSLLQAVNILLERNFPEEAVILGRELFTDSLQLAELAAQDSPGRAALVLGMANSELTEWENMEREATSLDAEHQTPPAMTEEIARRRKNIKDAMERFGVERLRGFPHEKQLARDHNRQDDLMDFQLAHRLVHRADMAQGLRTRKVGDAMGVYLANADPEWKAGVAAFAAQSCLHAFRAAGSIFGWTNPGPDEASEQLEQLVKLVKEEDPDVELP